MPLVSIQLLGQFQVQRLGKNVEGFKSNKARALLAYLVLEPERFHARSSLVALLWPEMPEEAAYGNLRSVLTNFRHILEIPEDILLIDRRSVKLAKSPLITCDASDFEENLASGNLVEAVAAYRGYLLEGFSTGSTPFDEWLRMHGDMLHQKALYALRSLAEEAIRNGDDEQAMRYARRQLEFDPANEEAHQQVIYLLALNGQRSAAIAQYEQCQRLLMQELAVEPSPITRKLVETIRSGKVPEPQTNPLYFRRSKPSPTDNVTAFVSRGQEISWLENQFKSAMVSKGKVVFITGDAGSGKTSLAEMFMNSALELHPRLIILKGICEVQGGKGDPYLPFREILFSLTGLNENQLWEAPSNSFAFASSLVEARPVVLKLLEEQSPDLADLLLSKQHSSGSPEGRSPASFLPQGGLFKQYGQLLGTLSWQYPLLIVLDDLQWADEGSLQLLSYLGRQVDGKRILIIGIYRFDEVSTGRENRRHPLETVVNEIQRLSGEVQLDLNHSDGKAFIEAYLNKIPNHFSAEFRKTLYRLTGGHALFTVELITGMQNRGDLLLNKQGRWVEGPLLDWTELPARMEAVIAERVGRLDPFWRSVLATASVEGERFTSEVLAQVLKISEQTMIHGLSQVTGRQHGLVVSFGTQQIGEQRLSLYRFRHIIFQEYLYKSLDEVERAHLHQAIGDALESLYTRNDTDIKSIAPRLALHFEHAGDFRKAARYCYIEGKEANRLAAKIEASNQLNHGLNLLAHLPQSKERLAAEMDFYIEISQTYILMGGWGSEECEQALERAYQLACEIENIYYQIQIIARIAENFKGAGQYEKAVEKCRQLQSLAQQVGDLSYEVLAQKITGECYMFQGRLMEGRQILEEIFPYLYSHTTEPAFQFALSASSPVASVFWSYGMVIMGFFQRARRRLEMVLEEIRRMDFPLLLGFGLVSGGISSTIMLRDTVAMPRYLEELRRLVEIGSFEIYSPFVRFATGWCEVQNNEIDKGLERMREWAVGWQQSKNQTGQPFLLKVFAETLLARGEVLESERILEGVLIAIEQTSGTNSIMADIIRLKGECQYKRGDEKAAEESYWRAIHLARQQGAKLWELYAVMSLCQMKMQQGKSAEFRPMLKSIYDWFTEGEEYYPLKTARELLEEMALASKEGNYSQG